MRTCNKCKTEKSLDDFYKDKYDILNRQKTCKSCQKTREVRTNTERYQKYRKSYLDRRNKERLDEKIRLFELFKTAKSRANLKGLEFSIDFEWLWELYNIQSGKCLLTGIQFKMERNKYNERFSFPFSISIDRIDSGQGYTKTNTRLVCTIVNLALNRFGDEAFKQMCESFISHQNKS